MAPKKTLLLVALALVCSAHDLFLQADEYFLSPFREAELFLFNGTFDESDNVITRDRIVTASVVGSETFLPKEADYYDKDDVTYLKIKTGPPGTYVGGVSTRPRVIELEADAFAGYLEHEGLLDVLDQREARGWSDRSAREKYAKHVKTIFQVGDQQTDHHLTDLGYPIEFIPLQNPYRLTAGDRIDIRLLCEGKPLPNTVVQYSCRPEGADRARPEMGMRTDAEGRISLRLDTPGAWYVSAIHMVESEEGNLDYESKWATLTFAVR